MGDTPVFFPVKIAKSLLKAPGIAKDRIGQELEDWLRLVWHQHFPKLPRVINFNANDVCNSHCIMCNIWKRSPEDEVQPDALRQILRDHLYSEVRSVGITGGEPSLRQDLPDLFSAFLDSLPQLRSMSMITNGIEAEQIFNQVLEIRSRCEARSVNFSMMVSLDGVGIVHDIVRGTKGNFSSALDLVRRLQAAGVRVSVGCTITKTNIYGLESFLDFLIQEGIPARFRIAEFIDRLYNQANTKVIRNFDRDEIYYLQLFYHRLIRAYETDGMIRRTYRSVLHQLSGGERLIGCPYQTDGVVLSSRGEIAYCAPRSALHSVRDSSSWAVYRKHLGERRQIVDRHCQSCIHDYHQPAMTTVERRRDRQEAYWKRLSQRGTPSAWIDRVKAPLAQLRGGQGERSVLIIGWYGTETAGDKAILGGVLEIWRRRLPGARFTVASLHPFLTERTRAEMSEDFGIIPVHSREYLVRCSTADWVVMGGGPLMDLEELGIPLHGFRIAKESGGRTAVEGCGVGPISGSYREVLLEIFRLSDEIRLRDHASGDWVRANLPDSPFSVHPDPAVRYIQNLRLSLPVVESSDAICCFFREWPQVYRLNRSSLGGDGSRVSFEAGLAALVEEVAARQGVAKVRLVPMHHFVVGGDDRQFARRFAREHFAGSRLQIQVLDRPLSVEQVLSEMKASRFNLCMRYHSVVFAAELETPFLAVDYTMGGKIRAYLAEKNLSARIVDTTQLESRRWPKL